MLTSKVNRHLLFALPCFAIVLILSCAYVAEAQFGGMGGAPAQQVEQRLFPNGLPKIEVMLKGALEHHPDVIAARSKLRAVEAELLQAEFKALKDIMQVRDRWEVARSNEALPVTSPDQVRERLAAVAAVEWELAFLIGARGEQTTRPATAEKTEKAQSTPQATTTAGEHQNSVQIETAIPHGNQAKSLKRQLSERISINASELPLIDFIKYLSTQSQVRFMIDKPSLENNGFPSESPISIDLEDLELGAALQVLEDVHGPLYFVVRDYGILVTAESEKSPSKVSAIDFWKLSEEELREKVRRDREEEARNNAGGMMSGGMGGMGGGGGGIF